MGACSVNEVYDGVEGIISEGCSRRGSKGHWSAYMEIWITRWSG